MAERTQIKIIIIYVGNSFHCDTFTQKVMISKVIPLRKTKHSVSKDFRLPLTQLLCWKEKNSSRVEKF